MRPINHRLKEVKLVNGVYYRSRNAETELYIYCYDYFMNNYRGVFFTEDDMAMEIFQNSFIKLWENIESKTISTSDTELIGNNGLPLTCNLCTYFMGIAKIKYLEYCRNHPHIVILSDPDFRAEKSISSENNFFVDNDLINSLFGDEENIQLEIISEVISKMTGRCAEILTKFYYEEKDLDTILLELPSISSKNALKTKKYKCMEQLKKVAQGMYNQFLIG